jgi:hypothetical protein
MFYSDMQNTPPPITPSNPAIPGFDPVSTRERHDGWTPERQLGFIEALAESACVADAAKSVGMSKAAAYNLRNRNEATAFRAAWDIALQIGVRQLGDAAISRALHGEVIPIFYKGEQVGERRRFDNNLTQFILRTQDPVRFGKWIDTRTAEPIGNPHAFLARATNALCDQLHDCETPRALSIAAYHDRCDPDHDPDDEEDDADPDEVIDDAATDEPETREADTPDDGDDDAGDAGPAMPAIEAVNQAGPSVADAPTPEPAEPEPPAPVDEGTQTFFPYYPPAKPRLVSDMAPGTVYIDNYGNRRVKGVDDG